MTRPERLRWGILGVSRINQRLVPAFKLARSADLAAIASRSLDKARQAASEYGIPRAYGSYEELLADPAIDAVYLPLPNAQHDPWTRQAADAGKHVLCEKPLCVDAIQAESLVAYCSDRGVRLMDGFFWPHHPRTRQLRKLLDAGAIGKVQRAVGAFSFQMMPLDPGNIRLRADQGGGSLLDVGCYPVYGIRWAMGEEPSRVFAEAKYLHGVDVEMAGQVVFSEGRTASFDCAFTWPLRGWLEIVGETGVIEVPEMWIPPERAGYRIRRDGKDVEEVLLPPSNQTVAMIDDFARAVIDGTPTDPDPAEAIRTLRVLDAAGQLRPRPEGDPRLSRAGSAGPVVEDEVCRGRGHPRRGGRGPWCRPLRPAEAALARPAFAGGYDPDAGEAGLLEEGHHPGHHRERFDPGDRAGLAGPADEPGRHARAAVGRVQHHPRQHPQLPVQRRQRQPGAPPLEAEVARAQAQA